MEAHRIPAAAHEVLHDLLALLLREEVRVEAEVAADEADGTVRRLLEGEVTFLRHNREAVLARGRVTRHDVREIEDRARLDVVRVGEDAPVVAGLQLHRRLRKVERHLAVRLLERIGERTRDLELDRRGLRRLRLGEVDAELEAVLLVLARVLDDGIAGKDGRLQLEVAVLRDDLNRLFVPDADPLLSERLRQRVAADLAARELGAGEREADVRALEAHRLPVLRGNGPAHVHLRLAVLRDVVEFLADVESRLAGPDLAREEEALAVLRVGDELLLVLLRRVVLRGVLPAGTERHEVDEAVVRLRVVLQDALDVGKPAPVDVDAGRGISPDRRRRERHRGDKEEFRNLHRDSPFQDGPHCITRPRSVQYSFG